MHAECEERKTQNFFYLFHENYSQNIKHESQSEHEQHEMCECRQLTSANVFTLFKKQTVFRIILMHEFIHSLWVN